jgi:hypothetical protein
MYRLQIKLEIKKKKKKKKFTKEQLVFLSWAVLNANLQMHTWDILPSALFFQVLPCNCTLIMTALEDDLQVRFISFQE